MIIIILLLTCVLFLYKCETIKLLNRYTIGVQKIYWPTHIIIIVYIILGFHA